MEGALADGLTLYVAIYITGAAEEAKGPAPQRSYKPQI